MALETAYFRKTSRKVAGYEDPVRGDGGKEGPDPQLQLRGPTGYAKKPPPFKK